MPRERLCKVCGQWHDLDEPWPVDCMIETNLNMADLAAPMISGDTMKAVRSQTNGLWYDSKSALRKEYKRAGVVEVGNDVPQAKPKIDWAKEKKKRTATIGRALSRAGLGAP